MIFSYGVGTSAHAYFHSTSRLYKIKITHTMQANGQCLYSKYRRNHMRNMLRICNCWNCFCTLATKHNTYQVPINFPSISPTQIQLTQETLTIQYIKKNLGRIHLIYIYFISTHPPVTFNITFAISPLLFCLYFFERFWFPCTGTASKRKSFAIAPKRRDIQYVHQIN